MPCTTLTAHCNVADLRNGDVQSAAAGDLRAAGGAGGTRGDGGLRDGRDADGPRARRQRRDAHAHVGAVHLRGERRLGRALEEAAAGGGDLIAGGGPREGDGVAGVHGAAAGERGGERAAVEQVRGGERSGAARVGEAQCRLRGGGRRRGG